jgi:hypothetical protein
VLVRELGGIAQGLRGMRRLALSDVECAQSELGRGHGLVPAGTPPRLQQPLEAGAGPAVEAPGVSTLRSSSASARVAADGAVRSSLRSRSL